MFSSEQYRALRTACGLVDRSSRGLLLLTGTDRRSYLQGLLTNDIEALSPGAGCYAALLTPQGRMIADMRVLESGDSILVDVASTTAPVVYDRFTQLIFGENVQVEDLSRARIQLGVYGPLAAGLVSRAFHESRVENVPPAASLEAMRVFANTRIDFRGAPVVAVRSDEIGIAGFDLIAERVIGDELTQALKKAGAPHVDSETADVCRVEAGRPLFHVDMDEDTIPLEAGIEQRAISFTKGCYVGQEIIIRVLHRGHGRVARRLVGLTFEASASVPLRGDRIRSAERDLGSITSAVNSPALGRPIALGYVRRDFAEPSRNVVVASAGVERTAVVTKLPFVTEESV